MHVLVITKPTNFEQHGEVVRSQIERGYLPESQLRELEEAHREHYESLSCVESCLKESGVLYDKISRGEKWQRGACYDFVVSVGGDGTLLSASHRILDETPVIGVRSSQSSVGYLCAGGHDEIEGLIGAQLEKKLLFAECARLSASIFYAEENQERQTVPVLNDFLFANHNPSATTRYHIVVGDDFEVHKSSGVWVSTATGSSAGILAAGGSRMARLEKSFQYKVRELYKGVKEEFFLTGGIFDPDKEVFRLENRNESAVLALDGQRGVIPLKFGDHITFKRAPAIQIALPFS